MLLMMLYPVARTQLSHCSPGLFCFEVEWVLTSVLWRCVMQIGPATERGVHALQPIISVHDSFHPFCTCLR